MRPIATSTILTLALASGLVAAGGAQRSSRPASPGPDDPTFRDFVGVNYLLPADLAPQLGVGWVRGNFVWPQIEPQKGQWKWGGTDNLIKVAQQQGLQVLCLLAFTAPWAASGPSGFVPPKNVQDWENFVEQVVARYSAPPYNLRYFQIWNEPTRAAGFWKGTDQQFVDMIYLPAAKIIRQHHCYVVFGGWPLSNSVQEYNQVLNYHNAWQWTDILDTHYLDASIVWQQLDPWIRSGKCRGLWETEIGYTADFSYLPRLYLHGLRIALRQGWTDPNQYKLFWFAAGGAGPDAMKGLSAPLPTGQFVLNQNGVRLKVLNNLLDGGSLALVNGVTTEPSLPPPTSMESPAALAFRVGGNRIVVAVLLTKSVYQGVPAVSMRVPMPQKPRTSALVNPQGDRQPVQAGYRAGIATVRVSGDQLRRDANGGPWAIMYVVLDGV